MMPFSEDSVPPVVEDSRTALNERITRDNSEYRVESPSSSELEASKLASNSGKHETSDVKGSSAKKEGKHHRRNLSAHFFQATRLTDDDSPECNEAKDSFPKDHDRDHDASEKLEDTREFRSPSKSKSRVPPPISPGANVGQKHRRGFSGDVSNPAVAHRRINSIGNSAAVDRAHAYYTYNNPSERPGVHRREDSAGLDMLSAVVDASKEEIEMAVGKRDYKGQPWATPSDPNRFERPQEVPSRVSPSTSSTTSYDYRRGHPHPPPPHRAYPHTYHPPVVGVSPTPSQPHGSYHPAFYPPGGSHPYLQQGYRPPYGQFAPPRTAEPYKRPYVVDHPQVTQSSSMDSASKNDRIDTDERLFNKKQQHQTTPPTTVWGPGGTTTGVQTFVTSLSVGEGTRTMQPTTAHGVVEAAPRPAPIPASVGHHRKLSSYSSLGTLMSSALLPEPEPGNRGHHRTTSSSVSFLHGLEDASDLFLQSLAAGPPPPSLQASFAPPSQPPAPAPAPPPGPAKPSPSVVVQPTTQSSGRALAQGGASKRIRRKCTVEGCPNRVVQGGLCISHGAARKKCKYPGCTKNVKKAGLCSTHGPARKRCEAEGCSKVAVQGGRCIAHGAKKKLCSYERCSKQAILAGMCKKHHDQTNGIVTARGGKRAAETVQTCAVINKKEEKPSHKSGHTRGLSIFQEISPDAVQNLLGADAAAAQSQQDHPLRSDGDRQSQERGYGNFY